MTSTSKFTDIVALVIIVVIIAALVGICFVVNAKRTTAEDGKKATDVGLLL